MTIEGGLNFKMAALHFVNVSTDVTKEVEENSVTKSTKDGLGLFNNIHFKYEYNIH